MAWDEAPPDYWRDSHLRALTGRDAMVPPHCAKCARLCYWYVTLKSQRVPKGRKGAGAVVIGDGNVLCWPCAAHSGMLAKHGARSYSGLRAHTTAASRARVDRARAWE